jgi:ferritin-like metal-binding protein YciE
MAKDVRTMKDLFLEEIRDLYDGERQITKALPKMAKASSAQALQSAFNDHLEQTRGHVERLERIFTSLDAKSGGVKCKAMEGLLREGDDMVSATDPGNVRDAGLIAAAQRVEHYEMAAYGSARAFAELLGQSDAAKLLGETLAEEKEADRLLNEIAETTINRNAAAESGATTGRAGGGSL